MTRKQIQKYLARLKYYGGKIDGIFGPKTKAAIRAFQRKYKLIIDGIAGPQTQAALHTVCTKPRKPKKEPSKTAIKDALIKFSPTSTKVAKTFKGKIEIPFTRRRINEIVVHCSATPEGRDYDANDINAWHKARGWSGIGYHFVILRDGTIEIGRPIGQVGAHVKGKNTGTVGISYIGGLASNSRAAKDTRTPAQRASALWLTKELADMFDVKRISGHNQYAAKACPCFRVRNDELGNIPGFKNGRRTK